LRDKKKISVFLRRGEAASVGKKRTTTRGYSTLEEEFPLRSGKGTKAKMLPGGMTALQTSQSKPETSNIRRKTTNNVWAENRRCIGVNGGAREVHKGKEICLESLCTIESQMGRLGGGEKVGSVQPPRQKRKESFEQRTKKAKYHQKPAKTTDQSPQKRKRGTRQNGPQKMKKEDLSHGGTRKLKNHS